jgi:hypothetical protein
MKHYYNPPSACDGIPTELVKYIGYYLEYRTHELNPPAVDKFKLLKKRLTGMQEFKQCSYLIKDVNNNFKNAMLSYYKFKKYAQNTIHRDLGLIKTLCKHARGMDVEVSPQMDDLELNRGDTYDIYLTFAELDKIELLNDNILTGDLASARDWLIISAYCAQRYSDFIRFTPEMIRPEGDNYIIEFTQLKTKENAGVMLHPKIINILNKRGWQFPKPIYIHKYNTYIKRICELAGITQVVKGGLMIDGRKEVGMYRKCDLVSSHIGRRSMITNYYGIMPTALLTTISGHKTINMLMTYLKKSNKDFAVEAFKYY